MTTFNYTRAAVTVTDLARKVERTAETYAMLANHFNLTAESESDVITDAARSIVVEGANNDGTATGKTITPDMLKGRAPEDKNVLPYWKAARTVRKGLVSAMGSKKSDDPDWLALVRTAVKNAQSHDIAADLIATAVADILTGV